MDPIAFSALILNPDFQKYEYLGFTSESLKTAYRSNSLTIPAIFIQKCFEAVIAQIYVKMD